MNKSSIAQDNITEINIRRGISGAQKINENSVQYELNQFLNKICSINISIVNV